MCDQLVTPQNESQARPLSKLDPEQQAEAWSRAVQLADGEQPTAKQVTEAAEEASSAPKGNLPKDGINEAAMRYLQEDIDGAIRAALTAAWERVKVRRAEAQWKHFLLGVKRWLNHSELRKS